MGTLAANRRIALAGLALRAGLQREDGRPVPMIEPVARDVSRSLCSLATTIRGEAPPPARLPMMEPRPLSPPGAAGTDIDQVLSGEIDMIVDGIETMGLLLRSEDDRGRGPGTPLERSGRRSSSDV